MARDPKKLSPGTIPIRCILVIGSIVSVSLVAILRDQHDHDGFTAPLALVIVSLVWFVVALGTAGWAWNRDAPFCPRRATALAIGCTIICACCTACAILTSRGSVQNGSGNTMRALVVGVQSGSAVWEFSNAVITACQIWYITKGSQQEHASKTGIADASV